MKEHRAFAWRGLEEWRAEYTDVSLYADRLLARGTQVGTDPVPYRLTYALDTAPGFVTARLTVDADGVSARGARWARRLDLMRDGNGEWQVSCDARGDVELPEPGGDPSAFAGALDCDLGFSPLTNSLPVLRERLLDGGDPHEFVMAWVSVPDLAVKRSEQRYEPLARGQIRYVGRHRDFTAELEFDSDGFVVRYPQLAERVYPRPA